MTPTLRGRWQTRIALLGTLGLAITAGYMWRIGAWQLGPRQPTFYMLPVLLSYVALIGLLWDLLYVYLQGFRWDRDWPLSFAFFCGIAEGALIFALFRLDWLPGAQYQTGSWRLFLLHYGTVFWVVYWWQFGPMRVLFPRWRFNGGELV